MITYIQNVLGNVSGLWYFSRFVLSIIIQSISSGKVGEGELETIRVDTGKMDNFKLPSELLHHPEPFGQALHHQSFISLNKILADRWWRRTVQANKQGVSLTEKYFVDTYKKYLMMKWE